MSAWEDIEVSTETRDFEEIENEFIQTGGLSITPEKLHNEFHINEQKF